MNTINFFSVLVIFLMISLFPTTLSAYNSSVPSSYCMQYSSPCGGFVIVAEGLVEETIFLEFTTQKMASKSTDIEVTIVADDGTIHYQEEAESAFLDFSNLVLPTGNYNLVVEIDGVVRGATFTR